MRAIKRLLPADRQNSPVSDAPSEGLEARQFSWQVVAVAAAASLVMGILLAALDGTGRWLGGVLAYTFLVGIGLAALLVAHRLVESHPAVPASLAAFALRLAAGVLLFLLFPTAGYPENPVTRAGYVFEDAYVRDRQALALARSAEPLASAFTGQYAGDQYGGMLALSAGVYRYLSPDGYRPFLILILAASAASLGVLLTWRAAANWFGESVAGAAAWVFAIYPEAVLLGSSQMREPFIMLGIAMTLYSASSMWNSRSWPVWMAGGAALLLLFQPPMAVFALVVLGGFWFFDPHRRSSWRGAAVLVLLVVAVALAVAVLANLPSMTGTRPASVFMTWLQNNFAFQTHQTERASGMFQKVIRDLGEAWRLPVVLLYGTAQPVLPAALGDKPTVPLIWRLISIFRAAGWYALAPFLVYGLFVVLRGAGELRRRQLLWLSTAGLVWVLIAAGNAGGDQWDNPRYRTVMLAWLAILAAWAWVHAKAKRDPWLRRWISIEVIFILVFTFWYLGRNYLSFIHLGLWQAVGLTLVFSLLVLLAGIWKDRRSMQA